MFLCSLALHSFMPMNLSIMMIYFDFPTPNNENSSNSGKNDNSNTKYYTILEMIYIFRLIQMLRNNTQVYNSDSFRNIKLFGNMYGATKSESVTNPLIYYTNFGVILCCSNRFFLAALLFFSCFEIGKLFPSRICLFTLMFYVYLVMKNKWSSFRFVSLR